MQAQGSTVQPPPLDVNTAGLLAAEGLLLPGHKVRAALVDASAKLESRYRRKYADKLRLDIAMAKTQVLEHAAEAQQELSATRELLEKAEVELEEMKGVGRSIQKNRLPYNQLVGVSSKNHRWRSISGNIAAIRRKAVSEASFGDMAIEAIANELLPEGHGSARDRKWGEKHRLVQVRIESM